METPSPDYILGYADAELERLAKQSRLYADWTNQILTRAGLSAGMRVLDAGCGIGDVSFIAATLVGPSGTVLGVDCAAKAVEVAIRRAKSARMPRICFRIADLCELHPADSFDALIGRFVLMHLHEPATVLRRLAGYVRPGGIVAFQELDISAGRAVPECGLFAKCRRWIIETYSRARVEIEMGARLFATFREAGLPEPQLTCDTHISGGIDSPAYECIADAIRSLLPTMVKHGVATADEIELDTLADRLRQEVVSASGVIVLPPLVGAWTRKSVA
jgi:ubiquinone/menaquinone biosynthesis C-methylase UbiE